MSSSKPRLVLLLSLLGLAGFLAFEGLLVRRFTRVDTRPPSWDQSIHLEIALDYREALKAGRWGDFWYLAPKPGMPPFPPAYHLLLTKAYDSADPARAALWLNWFYMAVLAACLFSIAWRFMPDGRALAAVLIFCAAPGLQELLTTQLVDLALVACVAAAYAILLAGEGFSFWLPSLAFGVVHAVGMLHKWSFFSYLLPAYWVWARTLAEPRYRAKALAAAGLSVALFAPWYASHIVLLPSRLVQASADFAVPFWMPGAWAVYLRQSCTALGPILWALGFVGLLAPQYARRHEQVWILTYWAVLSYAFWTLVPNRQVRFLLPGLMPLGLAFAAGWPRPLVWGGVIFQLVCAANFSVGWVGPFQVDAPFLPIRFLENKPPAREDWKIEEILRRVESERDPDRPLANMTLVANDEYFNAPTFHWSQRRLGLAHARVRGVNKRLCELSEFVLLKEGRLGPGTVIGGLPEAAEQIHAAAWFRAAYAESARWDLPDGSRAILYRQRRGRPAPLGRAVERRTFTAGATRVDGLRLEFGPWEGASSSWKTARAAADAVSVRGLVVRGVAAELEGLSFVPIGSDDLRLLRLDRVKVRGLEVGADDLKNFLEQRVPDLQIDRVTLEKTVSASGRWKGRSLAAEAALELDAPARRLRVRVVSASYMGTPLPAFLFRPIKELTFSLDPNPETPFFVDIPSLTIKNGRLTVP